MQPASNRFKDNARVALADEGLQRAMRGTSPHFVGHRQEAVDRLPEFDALRDDARDIKAHTLQYLDLYYERYEAQVRAAGGQVHFAPSAEDACDIVLEICRRAGAKTVTKGKSMISEEMGLNVRLSAAGITPVETDLGEYIIQLRGETPSHIIAPAVHVSRDEVEADFRKAHADLPAERNLDEPVALVREARGVLRERFLNADIGITGANLLIAETGSSVIVTNEGNGDLTQSLPRIHIVLASLEKMVPTLEDATTILRVLARSATGQEISVYTTFSTGPRRAEDPDGPEEYHVVILDNGRSAMLGGPIHDMLRCIRCGACMNHCPVYGSVGGHAYGWVYPGPMGSVLTPQFLGIEQAGELANASTLCGRCQSVCPVRIPLPDLLRRMREREHEQKAGPGAYRRGLALWRFFAARPRLYHAATGIGIRLLALLAGKRRRFAYLPFAGGWTRHRDLPAPEGKTFHQLWKQRKGPGA